MSAEDHPRKPEALELLKEGYSPQVVALRVGVSHATVYRWLRETSLICERCAEKLREPSPDGMCGFCQGEVALEVAA